ncbi:hypothetical protein CHN50_15210 [Priestia aryabhattai]|uniref:hypothetical protein n=1 Tax=Bacillaceae TaxID=186817 RepID=UPI000BA0F6FD|nr:MULTISPECIES: hypothetical protein [Bacillaceae]MDT2047867.1 hypothetical protein [Priestia flexa]OZT11822.1 hypothetical protein CHN50_15210 [Priestia aryabhattai]TDB52340.1 hypothetical protein EPL02_07810 [Bacillus sp. CBEL-1]USY56044.1 hypothetical protein NIZ91_05140 [Bacillus sp. 1780r2a1]
MENLRKSLGLNTMLVIISLSIPLILMQIYVSPLIGWTLLIFSPIGTIIGAVNLFKHHIYTSQ